jgi:regulatory protein
MDFLARREHSFYELKQKLLLKLPDAALSDVEAVLGRLREEKLQSDDRFAESYIRYRKSRGFGYHHIKADLSARHVSADILMKYLHSDDADWIEIAEALVQKKMKDREPLEFGCKRHRKLLRFLEARGFSGLEIRRVLEKKVSQGHMPV